MLERATGGNVDASSNDAAREDVAREAGRSAAGDLRLDLNLLAYITSLREGGDEFLVPLDRQGTWRRTRQAIAKANLSPARLRIKRNCISRPTRDSRTAAERDRT
jgi:hypothetical protein